MRRLRALLALLRVERRELRRHAARSLLVALLVAVPVAAIAGGSAILRTVEQTPGEARAHAMGRARARIDAPDAAALAAAVPLLGHGVPVVAGATGTQELIARGRRATVRACALPPSALDANGLAAGMLALASGRAPAGPDELALSAALASGLACAPGDTVTLADGEGRVTGIVLDPEDLQAPFVLRPPGAPIEGGAHFLLAEPPGAELAAIATRVREQGLTITLRDELTGADAFLTAVVFVVGGFGLFEAALVIAATFAVGLRRRQREIGLLGSTGAAPGGVVTALLVSSALLALVGSAGGAAAGTAVAAALHPFLDGWTGRLNGPLELAPVHLAAAVLLGVVSSVLAAALPAAAAARLPVRIALGGRRPAGTDAARWLRLGALALLLGAVLLVAGAREPGAGAGVAILGGSVLCVLGCGAASPWLLDALARRAAPLPLAWRLAVRDAGRFRARNGPVVAAVLAGMSTAVLVGSMAASVESAVAARGDGATVPAQPLLQVAVASCVLTGLVVVLVATALSSVESAADARVLHAVGADPSCLRSTRAARAGYLALLGCLLAVPAGLVPAAGLVRSANVALPFAVPWSVVLVTVAGLPLLAYGTTWVYGALRSGPGRERGARAGRS